MTKAPCKFHLLQGACSSPVVCRASLFLPCSLQDYRLRQQRRQKRACVPDAMQHGRSVLQPLASLSRTWAAAMMHCRSGTLQKLQRLDRGKAWPRLYRSRPVRSLAKVPAQREHARRADTVRRVLHERVRRVGLHRIRRSKPSLRRRFASRLGPCAIGSNIVASPTKQHKLISRLLPENLKLYGAR